MHGYLAHKKLSPPLGSPPGIGCGVASDMLAALLDDVYIYVYIYIIIKKI
jgi:hypothetical protein